MGVQECILHSCFLFIEIPPISLRPADRLAFPVPVW